MIDVHCHLSYKSFDKDRDNAIRNLQGKIGAAIDSAADIPEAKKSLEMHREYPNFIFSTLGLHPTRVVNLSEKEIEKHIEFIRENRNKICGIGEVGLDNYYIKKEADIQKTKDVLIKFIRLAKELKKPLIIHARDAFEESIEILEKENAENVLMHMFGAHHLLKRVIDNGWYVSMNTIILRSKKHRKIARDIHLDNLLTETDSPWLAPEGGRNTPISVKVVIEKIAEIRKTTFEEIDKATTENAIRAFGLRLE